jgi:choloylglycine hydrolase
MVVQPARPCSTFYIRNSGQPVFGRNYDWMVEVGLVVVNQRDVVKLAMIPDRPARWKSKYGSVTFNQYGREFPMGGMNEAGLVVEQMWLSETRYPEPDERGALNVLQWVQYQLDTAATVAEVLASDQHVRINPIGGAKVHYLVADRHGGCATVEFLDGKLVSHVGESLPATVLTNNTYEASLAYLKQHVGFAGTRPVAHTPSSLDRFVCASDLIRRYEPQRSGDVVDYAFDILRRVAQGKSTRWSIVYDIANQRIHFRTRSATERRFIDLRKLDFCCGSEVLILDVNRNLTGNVTDHLAAYTPERNHTLVRTAYTETPFLKDIPETAVDAVATYPLTCLCEPHTDADASKAGE